MCKLFIPFAHTSNIYDIDVSFFKKHNVKLLLMDIDNTLDSYKLYTPSDRSKDFIKKVAEAGIIPVVVSNNRQKKVSSYAGALGIDYVSSARKPFSYKIRRVIKKHNLNPEDVMFVGDQLMTDVLACKGAHIRVVLAEKLVKEDQITTKINRIIDRPIRKRMLKQGKLVDWRNI